MRPPPFLLLNAAYGDRHLVEEARLMKKALHELSDAAGAQQPGGSSAAVDSAQHHVCASSHHFSIVGAGMQNGSRINDAPSELLGLCVEFLAAVQ